MNGEPELFKEGDIVLIVAHMFPRLNGRLAEVIKAYPVEAPSRAIYELDLGTSALPIREAAELRKRRPGLPRGCWGLALHPWVRRPPSAWTPQAQACEAQA